jgi:hypothetical protein
MTLSSIARSARPAMVDLTILECLGDGTLKLLEALRQKQATVRSEINECSTTKESRQDAKVPGVTMCCAPSAQALTSL